MSSTEGSRWERKTWPELHRLAKDVPEAGVHFQGLSLISHPSIHILHTPSHTNICSDAIIYNRLSDHTGPTGQWFNELLSPTPWFASVQPSNNFQILNPSTLPAGIDSGTRFTSVCINTAIYLPYLLSRCISQGCTVKRGVLAHISDAATLHALGKADLVVNCTGLLARTLGGVMDETVVPVRGQIVVVRNSPGAMYTVSGTDDGADEVSYIMFALIFLFLFLILNSHLPPSPIPPCFHIPFTASPFSECTTDRIQGTSSRRWHHPRRHLSKRSHVRHS